MISNLVLASSSKIRSQILSSAGVGHTSIPPKINEPELRSTLIELSPKKIAYKLAEQKARSVLGDVEQKFILGCDQVLFCSGKIYSKPEDVFEAKTQLEELRGKTHQLITVLCVFKDKAVDWHCVDISSLKMRSFSDLFLESYVNKAGEALFCPGAYQLEGLGSLLFDDIDGDYFSILGLPLISLLEYLRKQEVIQT